MTSVAAHGRYRAYIPNGYIIPNPCPAADGGEAIWNGVGHLNVEGRGALNPFGQDFADNGKVRKDIIFISLQVSPFEFLCI